MYREMRIKLLFSSLSTQIAIRTDQYCIHDYVLRTVDKTPVVSSGEYKIKTYYALAALRGEIISYE